MTRKGRNVVFLCALLALFTVNLAHAAADGCSRSDGSAVTYFDDCCCYACAYTGCGCTYCWATPTPDSSSYGTCYTDSPSGCWPNLTDQWW